MSLELKGLGLNLYMIVLHSLGNTWTLDLSLSPQSENMTTFKSLRGGQSPSLIISYLLYQFVIQYIRVYI